MLSNAQNLKIPQLNSTISQILLGRAKRGTCKPPAGIRFKAGHRPAEKSSVYNAPFLPSFLPVLSLFEKICAWNFGRVALRNSSNNYKA